MVSPYLLKPLRTEEQALRDIKVSAAYCWPETRLRARSPVRRPPDAGVRREISVYSDRKARRHGKGSHPGLETAADQN